MFKGVNRQELLTDVPLSGETMKITAARDEEAAEIHHLMEQVHAEMEHPEHFVCDDLPFVRRHIREEGFCLTARDADGELVGALIVRFPGMAEDNLGRELSLPEKELGRVAHMESVVVAGQARGQGLFTQLLSAAEGICAEKGFRYLMGTVSPDNPASFKSFEKQGYGLIVTKPKYGGLMRRIYSKRIPQT